MIPFGLLLGRNSIYIQVCRYLLWGLIGLSYTVRAVAQEPPVAILTGEWAPYTSAENDHLSSGMGGGYGLVTELVTEALKQMGKTPNYLYSDWATVLEQLQQGDALYAYPYVKTPEREANFLYSDPLFDVVSTLFYNIENINQHSGSRGIKETSDFNVYSVGIVAEGYAYDEQFIGQFREQKAYKTEFLAFQAMVAGSVDMVLMEATVGAAFIKNYFLDQQHRVARLRDFAINNPVSLIAVKNNASTQEFISAFNAALKTIREHGVVRKISSQYDLIRDTSASVRLVGSGSYPLAFGSVDKDDKEGFLIPLNTPAAVVQWNPLFQSPSRFDIHKAVYEKTRVKILEGPLENQLLWVPNMFLSYE